MHVDCRCSQFQTELLCGVLTGLGFPLQHLKCQLKAAILDVFKSSPHANCCSRQVCVWCWHLSAIECGLPLFMEREAVTREPVLVAPFSNHQLPAKERVTSIPKVRTKIGGGPYQQLSPDQCLALGPFVRPNPTTSNQANFNLTYR